jgi:hypothetical protein
MIAMRLEKLRQVDYIAIVGQHAVMTPLVTNVDANRELTQTLFFLK